MLPTTYEHNVPVQDASIIEARMALWLIWHANFEQACLHCSFQERSPHSGGEQRQRRTKLKELSVKVAEECQSGTRSLQHLEKRTVEIPVCPNGW